MTTQTAHIPEVIRWIDMVERTTKKSVLLLPIPGNTDLSRKVITAAGLAAAIAVGDHEPEPGWGEERQRLCEELVAEIGPYRPFDHASCPLDAGRVHRALSYLRRAVVLPGSTESKGADRDDAISLIVWAKECAAP